MLNYYMLLSLNLSTKGFLVVVVVVGGGGGGWGGVIWEGKCSFETVW